MRRIPEPELMLEFDQATAYANADFSATDADFVTHFLDTFGNGFDGDIIDLGCGPGNITLRLAAALPHCRIIGVDGSAAMLTIGRARARETELDRERILFVEAVLPSEFLSRWQGAAIVSNSLLHHLHDPLALWHSLRRLALPGAAVLIRDLRRPESPEAAETLVETYARDAPAVLRSDYYNSLLAAFEPEEVAAQLQAMDLDTLVVTSVGDRHLEVRGRLPG